MAAITQMTNVTGQSQPIDEIADIIHDAGGVIMVDGAQSVGHIPVDISKMDYLAIAGHKGLLGPQGIGALFADDPDTLKSSQFGGGTVSRVSHQQVTLRKAPARFEPGTPNILGSSGSVLRSGLWRSSGSRRSICMRNRWAGFSMMSSKRSTVSRYSLPMRHRSYRSVLTDSP